MWWKKKQWMGFWNGQQRQMNEIWNVTQILANGTENEPRTGQQNEQHYVNKIGAQRMEVQGMNPNKTTRKRTKSPNMNESHWLHSVRPHKRNSEKVQDIIVWPGLCLETLPVNIYVTISGCNIDKWSIKEHIVFIWLEIQRNVISTTRILSYFLCCFDIDNNVPWSSTVLIYSNACLQVHSLQCLKTVGL